MGGQEPQLPAKWPWRGLTPVARTGHIPRCTAVLKIVLSKLRLLTRLESFRSLAHVFNLREHRVDISFILNALDTLGPVYDFMDC